MAPKSVGILAIEVVILFRMNYQRNLAHSLSAGSVVVARHNIGNICFYKFLHNGAMATFLCVKRVPIAIECAWLRKILTAVFSVILPAFSNQHGITVIEGVCVAVHRFVRRFIVVPCLGFKGRFRSTLGAHRAIDVLEAEKGTKKGDFLTRCVRHRVHTLTPWFRFFRA